jgi:hypothetical protein
VAVWGRKGWGRLSIYESAASSFQFLIHVHAPKISVHSEDGDAAVFFKKISSPSHYKTYKSMHAIRGLAVSQRSLLGSSPGISFVSINRSHAVVSNVSDGYLIQVRFPNTASMWRCGRRRHHPTPRLTCRVSCRKFPLYCHLFLSQKLSTLSFQYNLIFALLFYLSSLEFFILPGRSVWPWVACCCCPRHSFNSSCLSASSWSCEPVNESRECGSTTHTTGRVRVWQASWWPCLPHQTPSFRVERL